MPFDPDFIQDLQDEGLVPSEFLAEYYEYNWYNGTAAMERHPVDGHSKLSNRIIFYRRCSVNQSSLSGWTWLIGSAGGGLKPLLCATRRRDGCPVNKFEEEFAHIVSLKLLVALCCLFALVNLFTLAVWSRCKSPAAQREVRIQLFMLRLFSILDIAGCLSPVVPTLVFIVGSRVRVLSALHAILLASFINLCAAASRLYLLLKSFWTFLTSIFLVEHSHPAQRVLLFASLRRAQVLLAAPLLVCLVPCVLHFLVHGSLYCVHDSRAYVITDYFYTRLPDELYRSTVVLEILTHNALQLLALILLIVFASKRCCSCCRDSPSPDQTADSVIYVPQRNNDEEEGASGTMVAIEHGSSSMPEGSALADELRRLIFWLEVAFVGRGVLFFISAHLSYYLKPELLELYYQYYLVSHAALYGLAALLSPILSATFRAGLLSVLRELRAASGSLLQWRPW